MNQIALGTQTKWNPKNRIAWSKKINLKKQATKNLHSLQSTQTHKPLQQLVAAATMFIASKLADPCPITGTELVRYTNDTYNLTELLVSEFH